MSSSSNPPPHQKEIDAGGGYGQVADPYIFYALENRHRVNAAILAEDPKLKRLIEIDDDDEDDSISPEDFYEAEDKLREKGDKILKAEYAENVSEAEKERYRAIAIEQRNNNWRSRDAVHKTLF